MFHIAQARVTIQSIAKELGMSRNTVSKALKGDKNVASKTTEIVINKAKEMNYKGFISAENNSSSDMVPQNIVFLSSKLLSEGNFWPSVVVGIEKKLSQLNHNFSIKRVTPDLLSLSKLTDYFQSNDINGVICSELFDKDFMDLLSKTKIPFVTIDNLYDTFRNNLYCDIIMMENVHSIQSLTKQLIEMGHTKIGFVGKYDHCLSFYERFLGFNNTFYSLGLKPPSEYNLIPLKDDYSIEWIKKSFNNMKSIPTAMVCANDSIAINVIKAAKQFGLQIPGDLAVTGFDNVPECSIIEPHLTTVNINKIALGQRTVEVLFWRIENPDRPFEITYIENEMVYRNSI